MTHIKTQHIAQNEPINHITIISEQHCWRTLSGIKTSDYYEYQTAIRNGCHLQRASFDLRYPEEMICDLSNLDQIYNGMCREKIIKIWCLLDTNSRKIKISNVGRISGDGLSPEIAIFGPTKSVLTQLKTLLIRDAFSHVQGNATSTEPDKLTRGISKSRLLINSPEKTVKFHNDFCAFYSKHISNEHWETNNTLNTRYIYQDHEVWHQLRSLSKNKLFLLSAGLPLALGYMAATGDTDVYFSEVHRQNDSSLLNKKIDFQDIYPQPTSPREPWIIIDKAYTGGSLRQAANEIRKKYGYDVDIKTVSLFPKSYSAFMSSDYAVYAGKLFNVREYSQHLERDLWHIHLIED